MSDAAEKGSVMLYGVSLAYEESAGDRGVQHGVARAFSMRGGSSFVLIRLSTGDSFIHCTARALPLGCTALLRYAPLRVKSWSAPWAGPRRLVRKTGAFERQSSRASTAAPSRAHSSPQTNHQAATSRSGAASMVGPVARCPLAMVAEPVTVWMLSSLASTVHDDSSLASGMR
jgi:hypothetical protein